MKNPIFYKKSNANSFKKKFELRKIFLGSALALFVMAMFAISINHSTATGKKLDCAATGYALLTVGTVVQKEGETDEAYFARILTKMDGDIEKALKAENPTLAQGLKDMREYVEQTKGDRELLANLKKELAELKVEFEAEKEPKKKSKFSSTAEQLKANKEAIMKLAKGTDSKEVVIKVVTERASITTNEQAYDLPEIGQLATRKVSLYDIFPKLTVSESNNNGTIRYYDWDEDTIARAAAAVAEKGTFPESTAKFKKGSITLQKVGDTLPVTEEFFEDEAMFAAELEMFLNINVALEMDRQLADGDGTGNTITGLKSSVNAYTLPGTGTVVSPTLYDLIVKLSEAITTTGGAKYMPDFAVMHISDINRMKLAKDLNGNYVLPPFVSKDGNQVSTVTVFESNIITADTMVIGDRRFARIYEKGGVELSRGLVNAQFTADEMTLKARKRIALLIRAADKSGFLKVTSIDAAIAAIKLV